MNPTSRVKAEIKKPRQRVHAPGHDTEGATSMQHDPNPSGLCLCGCGAPTRIERQTDPRRGTVKGKPRRFIRGHGGRKKDRYEVRDCGYETPCHIWLLHKNPSGYGREGVRGRTGLMLAHVSAWERLHGPVPHGLELDHLCRVRSCVNPDHLEPVTHTENMRRSSAVKLDTQKAKAIKELLRQGRTLQSIGDEFGVNKTLIHKIKQGLVWKDA